MMILHKFLAGVNASGYIYSELKTDVTVTGHSMPKLFHLWNKLIFLYKTLFVYIMKRNWFSVGFY